MPRPFFSDPLTGWLFYATLVAMLTVAAIVDLRKAVIPKWLTLSLLGAGVLANIIRGALLGAAEDQLWLFPTGSAWVGGLDGLLLALAGFGLAFAAFLFMWVLGTCGGGDVKLFSALGAWVGPVLFPFLLLGSVIILAGLFVFKLMVVALTSPATLKAQMQSATAAGRKGKEVKKRPLRMTYSLPAAVAVALLLLWFFRVELNLAPARPDSPRTMVSRHAP
jgi:prepilin peptidase CpaA